MSKKLKKTITPPALAQTAQVQPYLLTDIPGSPSQYLASNPILRRENDPLINHYTALTIPAYWRAVRLLVGTCATLPRSVMQKVEDKRLPSADHPFNKLLNGKPNNYQSAKDFEKALWFHYFNWGNSYAWIERDPASFDPVAIHNVLPTDMVPFRTISIELDDDGNEISRTIDQWYRQLSCQKTYFAADVIHLKYLSYDGQVGLDPVEYHRDTLTRARLFQKHQKKFLKRGTIVSGAVQIPTGLTKQAQQEVIDYLRKHFSGANADENVLVLSDGATLNNAAVSPQQAQFVEQSAKINQEICQITGVTPQAIFEYGRATWANAEQMGEELVKYSLREHIEEFEEEFTSKGLSEADQDAGFYVHINVDGLLRGNKEAQSEILVSEVAGGILTPNEARALSDLPPIDDPSASQLLKPAAPAITAATPTASTGSDDASNITTEDSEQPSDDYGALKPIIDATFQRIERKTEKAFEAKANKPQEERIAWGNAFADEQKKTVIAELKPVFTALTSIKGSAPEVEKVAERYSRAIKRAIIEGSLPKSVKEMIV